MELNIDINEAIRYMGYRTPPDERQMAMIERCCEQLKKAARPRFTYRVFELSEEEGGLRAGGTNILLSGEDIRRHLQGCEECVIFCATVSSQADELIRRMEAEDIALGYMTDCLAGAAVEGVCNNLERELAASLEGRYFTWRFSPGYGDLPLDLQPQIISVLEAPKRVGVTCTPTLLLVPRKSVTAIIGLSRTPIEKGRRGCAVCAMAARCEFRKRGTHCGH